MASVTHGSIGEFDPGREDWVSYTERLEEYFTANGIANDDAAADKRRAILLSVCGATTYQLIRNLLAPEKPSTKSFAQLVKLVKDHHHPTPSAVVQRKNFRINCKERHLPSAIANHSYGRPGVLQSSQSFKMVTL